MFALQDEPEKGKRLLVFAVGTLVALGVQGGSLVAAHQLSSVKKKNSPPILVNIQVVPPPPPKVEPPPPPPPPPEVEPPPPPPEPPKPKPKPKPKKKPKPVPKPDPIDPPKVPPKKPPPLIPGLDLSSTVMKGAGPTFAPGNTRMGEPGRVAAAKVEPAAGIQAEPPESEPASPPVRKAPKFKRKVRPNYTDAARRAGIEGTVVLLLTIDEAGRVSHVQVVKGLGYGLDKAAAEAARKWIFAPGTVDGRPTRMKTRISYRYILED